MKHVDVSSRTFHVMTLVYVRGLLKKYAYERNV